MFESFGIWLNSIALTLVGGHQESVGFVTAVMMSFIIVSLRRVPGSIIRMIRKRFLKSIIIDSSYAADGSDDSKSSIARFISFINENIDSVYTNSYRPASYWSKGKMSIGSGRHILVYKRRLWFIKLTAQNQDASSSNKSPRNKLVVSTLTMDKSVIKNFIDETMVMPYLDLLKIKYESIRNDGKGSSIRPDSVMIDKKSEKAILNCIYNKDVEESFINDVEKFCGEAQWYLDKGLPYRKTYLLEGPPGTGKTNLVKYLAVKNRLDIVTGAIDSNIVKDELRKIMSMGIKTPKIILIEDIDRDGKVNNSDSDHDRTNSKLGDILNQFDGIVSLSNVIIVFTTNHMSKLDQAFLRKGRIDKVVHIGYLDTSAIDQFIVRNYGRELNREEKDFIESINGNIRTCDIFYSWKEYPDDLDGFLKDLKQEVESVKIN